MPFQKRTLLHVKQLPVSSQISSSREEKRPMLFYTDWLVMERNSSSSLTVLLASCKWTHLHELTPALSKPKTAGRLYLLFPVCRDKGMTHMVGKNWRDFFDVIIVHADKPHFFTDCIKWVRQSYRKERWVILWLLINSDSLCNTHSSFCPVL